MSKHTDGPWRVMAQAPRIIETTDGDYVAKVYNDFDPDESDANARMIAASPAMFSALEGALGWLERYAGDTQDLSPELWRHIQAARLAVTEARLGSLTEAQRRRVEAGGPAGSP